MSSLLALAQAGALGLLVVLTARIAYRFALFGAGLVLLLFLLEALIITFPEISLGVISVYPQDLVFVTLAVAGAARLLPSRLTLRRDFSLFELGWLLFGSLIFFSLLRGISTYGLEVAGVDFRQYFYVFSGTLYFISFPVDQSHLKKLTTLWFSAAGALALLALLRWIAEGLGLSITAQWEFMQVGGNLRVLNAAQTLFLAQTVFMCLQLWLVPRSSRLGRYFPVILLPLVVLLQHRTVWIACLLCILLIMYQERRLRSRILVLLSTGAAASAILILLIPTVLGDNMNVIIQSLYGSFVEALSMQEGTLFWRVESWRVLLTNGYLSTSIDYLFGKPFGAGWARYISGVEEQVNISPHNYYVQTLLRVGVFGLAVLAYLYIVLLLRLRRFGVLTSAAYFGPKVISVLLVSQLLYFMANTMDYSQGLLLGLAMAVAGYSPQSETHSRKKVKVVWTIRG